MAPQPPSPSASSAHVNSLGDAHLLFVDEQEALLAELEKVEWVSYIEPPPHEGCRAELVLKYLARYLTGGPISDARIVSADERQVTFLAREGKGKRCKCPKCGAAMGQTAASLKPSWHDVMNSSYRPNWYSHIRPRL
ncbi:MAG: transposase [Pirellulaceae bacterium]|nr:transposase [Pirellulaceae bacterium]